VSASRDNLPAVEEEMPLDAHAKNLGDRIFKRGALTILVALGVGGLLTLGGYAVAQGSMRAVSDAGVAPVAKDLAAHIKDEGEARAAQTRFNERFLDALQSMEERSAKRFDALQNTVLERRAQPESAELARPAAVKATDGGGP